MQRSDRADNSGPPTWGHHLFQRARAPSQDCSHTTGVLPHTVLLLQPIQIAKTSAQDQGAPFSTATPFQIQDKIKLFPQASGPQHAAMRNLTGPQVRPSSCMRAVARSSPTAVSRHRIMAPELLLAR